MVETRNMIEGRPFISQFHRNAIQASKNLSFIYALNSYSHSGEDLKSTYTKNFIDTYNSSLNEIGM